MRFPFNLSPRLKIILRGLMLGLAVLLIGLLGGVWGFLLLSNTTNPSIIKLRQSLGFADNPAIPSVQTQKVTLEESSLVIDAVKKISPSVVSVATASQVKDLFGNVVGQSQGGGSGFIITADGYIMTNKHVVEGQSAVTIVLADGTEYEGRVVSTDPFNDVAVVKVEAKDLPAVELGDSDQLQIGQMVIAVGNAFGEFQNTVTKGVVSAKNRWGTASGGFGQSEKLLGLLQTDASVNPGNSGGPLVNLIGQVVGMTTAIASSSGSSAGVNFAIPVNSFRSAINSTIKSGRIIRPGLGVRYIPVTKALAEQNNLTVQYGALVSRGESSAEVAVLPDSPAAAAGIKEGDIILKIDGEQITTDRPLPVIIGQYEVGDRVSILLQRDGKELTVEATLQELSS